MTDGPTLEVIDDKLKIAALETDLKLSNALSRMEAANARTEAAVDRLAAAITGETGILAQVKALKDEGADTLKGIRADNSFTRWTIGVTGFLAVIAVITAMLATQGNLLAAISVNLSAHPPASAH